MKSRLAFDRSPSLRREDDNGFLHVASSHITKATVNPYRGGEIPGWREAGLDPERIYYGLRDPGELKKSLKTWEGLPLHIEHHLDSADEPAKLTRVGAVGTGARWNGPYVDAPLTIWDGEAIDAVRDGSFRELSCAYFYTPDFTPGQYEGIPYDFVMRDIRGNHVALVGEGRAGRDVLVADAALTPGPIPAEAREGSQTHDQKPNPIKGAIMKGLKRLFRGAKDANPDIEREEVDLAQAIIDLHKVDPATGEIVDITEDEDKAAEIRRLVEEMSAKLDPGDVKRFKDALADLAYSKATGDSEPGKSGPDEDTRKAMDACGLDADDEGAQAAFAEGVKYGESLIRNPAERAKLDREHESEGMKKAMGDCGLDAENPQESRAFAEGVKYGEKLERNPEERKKLDREHEREGEEKALGRDEDKNAAIGRILDEVPGLTPEQREKLTNSLQDLAYSRATGDSGCRVAQDAALRRQTPALDAALIEARAVARAQDNMRRLQQASRAVRPLVGDLDPLAFDSAADIYAYALKENGVNPRDYPRQAWAGMVDVMRSGKALGSGSPRLAADSARAGAFDGPFAGLKNITVAD